MDKPNGNGGGVRGSTLELRFNPKRRLMLMRVDEGRGFLHNGGTRRVRVDITKGSCSSIRGKQAIPLPPILQIAPAP
jgi:hypothetical protein